MPGTTSTRDSKQRQPDPGRPLKRFALLMEAPPSLARRYRPHGHNGEPGHFLPDDANRTEPEDMRRGAARRLPGISRA